MSLKKQIKQLEKLIGYYNAQFYAEAITKITQQIWPPAPPEPVPVADERYLSRAEFDAFFDYCVAIIYDSKGPAAANDSI